MAFPRGEDFEGIADETTLTTSNTDFSSFSGTTPVADTARAHGGSVSMRVDGGNGAEASGNFAEADATHVWARIYLYRTAQPSSAPHYIFASGGSATTDVRVNSPAQGTAGQVAIRTNGTLRSTSTALLSVNQWTRIDIEIEASVIFRVHMFNDPESDTPTETISTTTTLPADIDSGRFGKVIVNAEVVSAWMDDILYLNQALPSVEGKIVGKSYHYDFATKTLVIESGV